MPSDDLVGFCLPNFAKCGSAVGDIVPILKEALEHLLSLKWLDASCSGSKDWTQDPVFACWANLPLCLGVYCVPCCMCAVFLRLMEKMSGKSCESNCLTCCLCGYCYACYYAKKRTEFRSKYGLKGAPLFDCCGPCLCGPCMLCQDANELQTAGQLHVPFCSAKAAADMRAKVAPEGK